MSCGRLWGTFAHLTLILFSSTPLAGKASQSAYSFYLALFGMLGMDWGVQTLAQKGLHFALFFSLGSWLSHSLHGPPLQKFLATAGMCLLVGLSSESFQLLFPGRQATLADVLLNAASGTLAAGLAWRCSPSPDVS